MEKIYKGQKVSLNGLKSKLLNVGIKWDQNDFPLYEIDANLMLLSDKNKLEKEENFIFYNNPVSHFGEAKINTNPLPGYQKSFSVNLEKIPDEISHLNFMLTINNGEELNQRFGNIKDIKVDLIDEENNEVVYSYELDGLTSETLLILVEIYKYKNEWKLKAVGNGFYAGLDKILPEYVSENVHIQTHPLPNFDLQKDSKFFNKKNDLPEEKTAVSLTKITLQKKGDSTKIFLEKGKAKLENIYVKLYWKKGVDLDLHAFYKNTNNKTGEIYFAGKGSLKKEPFIQLDQDAGVGNISGNNEENLIIATLEPFDTILIAVNIFRFFGFMSKGENFAKYDGVVVVKTNRGDEIKVPLTSEELGLWCVIMKIDNRNPLEPRIVNINQVLKTKPSIEEFTELLSIH